MARVGDERNRDDYQTRGNFGQIGGHGRMDRAGEERNTGDYYYRGQGGQGMAPQPIYQNPGVTGGQGGQGMVPQPIYQLSVQQPGTVVQGEQGNQGGQRTQGPREEQGVQEKAKEILGNLLAQYNN